MSQDDSFVGDGEVELDGQRGSIAGCRCTACSNGFFVWAKTEYQPSYCPYCGVKFVGYKKPHDDIQRNLSGMAKE
jgi:hypothetical protein